MGSLNLKKIAAQLRLATTKSLSEDENLDALRAFAQAGAALAADQRVLANAGMVYFKTSDHAAAADHLKRSFRLDPSCDTNADFHRAIKSIRHALRRMPSQLKGRDDALQAVGGLMRLAAAPVIGVEAVAVAGQVVLDLGKKGRGVDVLTGALCLAARRGDPVPKWLPGKLGLLLVGDEDFTRAEAVVRPVYAQDPEGCDQNILRVLVRVVLQDGSRAPDAEAIFHRCLTVLHRDRVLAEDILDGLTCRMSEDRALQWLESVQDGAGFLLRGVLLAIENQKGRHYVQERFGLDALARTEPYLQYGRAWKAVQNRQRPAAEDLAVFEADKSTAPEIFFRFMTDEIRQLPLCSRKPVLRRELRAQGVKVKAVRDFLADFMKVKSRKWRRVLKKAGRQDKTAARVYIRNERQSGWLDQMVRHGDLEMIDPFTGKMLKAVDSFVAFGRSVYTFNGSEWFVLIAGNAWSGAIGLYVPRLSLALPFRAMPTTLLGVHMPTILQYLFRRLSAPAEHPLSTPAVVRPGRRDISLYVPSTDNFAHHMWNFYSAIERLIVTDRLKHVTRVIFSGTEFFGPLTELFPELQKLDFHRPKRVNVVDPYPFDTSGLVLQSGGYFISKRLSERIISNMRNRPRTLAGAIEPADLGRLGRRPVIWIGLRLRDKAWVDQETGTVELIERILRKHPEAIFLLDGFSYPVGEDFASETWLDVIVALKAMGDRIREATRVPDQVINMVGNSLRESVLWTQAVDVYLTPYGTSQHKVGWFTPAPGIVYVPPTFTPEGVARSPACTASEAGTRPHFIFAETASKGERRGPNRAREKFHNVSIRPKDLALAICARLSEQVPDRRARRQNL